MTDKLIIKGARSHNLKDVSLVLPKHKMIVFTGLSGSGKSSLAFDTIYAEGQRRYMESLSAYARQFLNQLDKPDVDVIEGLSPAISIDQKVVSYNPRSTVGTVTEIYDHFRLLFASIGEVHCHICDCKIERMSVQEIFEKVLVWADQKQVLVMAPLVTDRKGEFRDLFEQLRKDGFVRVSVDGEILRLDELKALKKQDKHTISLVVDRIRVAKDNNSRLFQSIETALLQSGALVSFQCPDLDSEKLFSEQYTCSTCDVSLPELSARLFSFNSPLGACSSCKGLGYHYDFDATLVFPSPEKALRFASAKVINLNQTQYGRLLERTASAYGFDLDTAYDDLTEVQRNILLYGQEESMPNNPYYSREQAEGVTWHHWEGVLNILRRRSFQTRSEGMRFYFRNFMSQKNCSACLGARLNPSALAVKVQGQGIVDLCEMSILALREFFMSLDLSEQQKQIATQVLKEIDARLLFMTEVGLGYLSLNRRSNTLSGGEFQRIRLATQIGSGLTGVLYVLDEPSIGLHQRDNDKLLQVLQRLKNLGNTLIVVEHDEDAIRSADYIVDIGPKAGRAGGEIVFSGDQAAFRKDKRSLTGQYLRGEKEIALPKKRRAINPNKILRLEGVSEHNLKNINVSIPLGCFVAVTGVSGSGKSTLVYDVLYRGLMRHFHRSKELPGKHKAILGLEHLDKVITIDQSAIGRTPRSNPITYTGVFSAIRDLFVKTREARVRGYKPGRFSFNVKGGRCESCSGDGVMRIEMHFLSDVYVTCDVCKGKRYNRETLEVHYKGKTIADVLDMTVNDGVSFFEQVPAVISHLRILQEVGLGYIQLGQSATTLSGGEAQRVKLAKELSRRSTGKTLYLLDEPTTGLHFADVDKLLTVLQRLVDAGNSLLVVEHHLDVIKVADHVIDLGPEGGIDGGEVVVQGSPNDVAQCVVSHTGKYLKPYF